MMWTEYWVWFAAALVLGILEILAPGYILLGFALAAGVIGALFYIDGGVGSYLATSLPITLAVFAATSGDDLGWGCAGWQHDLGHRRRGWADCRGPLGGF